MRQGLLSVLLLVLAVGPVRGQGAEEEVRRALQEGNTAARSHDRAGYAKFLADELRWIDNNTGQIQSKQQRLDGITPTGTAPPTISDVAIKVYGDTAAMTALFTSPDGKRQSRALRMLVKRDGRWQLLLHSQTPIVK